MYDGISADSQISVKTSFLLPVGCPYRVSEGFTMKQFVRTGTGRVPSPPSQFLGTATASATWVQGSGVASHERMMLQGLLTPGRWAVIADRENMGVPWATALTFNLCLKEAPSFLPVFHHATQIRGSEMTTRRVKSTLDYSKVSSHFHSFLLS